MTTTECTHCDELSTAVEAAHEHALRAFTDPDGNYLAGISWLSAHLGAVDESIGRFLRRHSIASAAELREQRAVNRRLHHELRTLEQALAGDALAARVDISASHDRIITALAEHAAGEHLLLDRLGRHMGAETAAAVAARYHNALVIGPTRPHPRLPSTLPVIGGVVRRAARVRDHVLDTLDGRHNPLPRQRRSRREPGRWGHYLLGTPLDATQDDGRND